MGTLCTTSHTTSPTSHHTTSPTSHLTTIMEDIKEMVLEIIQNPHQAFKMTAQTLQKLGWADVRPWNEFCDGFAKPSNLEERLNTNFIYYRSNYAVLLVVLTLLSVVSSPRSFLFVLLGICGAGLFAKNRAMASGILGFGLLMGSRSLLYGILLGLVVCLLHVIFRTRSIKSRFSAAMDERKL